MYEPELFAQNNKGTRDATKVALEKYGHLIQWKEGHRDTVLDAGCGPGDVLVDLIMPHYQGNFSKCYGTDISDKMIEYAEKKYLDLPTVKFLQIDVLDVDLFLKNYGQVDHVISTLLLHWVSDQKKALMNMHSLLTPGGDLFSMHCCNSGYFDVLTVMEGHEKWSKYWDNLSEMVPKSHTAMDPEQELLDLMADCGFTGIFVDTFLYQIKQSADSIKQLFRGAAAQIYKIPEEQRMEYVEDFFECAVQSGFIKLLPNGEATMESKMFIAYGRKE